MSEDFNWTALYIAADEKFLPALFSHPFFLRPASIAWVIGTQILLPWDPLAHHIRNFVFTLLNLFLLHRILLRVTLSTPPRVLGLAFFALNKVHLTAIGWINVFEIIVTLMHFLLILLFLLRYLQEGRKWDYCLALGGFLLTVFSRDYSIVLLAVVVAIFYLRALDERGNPARWRSALGMLVPFCMVAALHCFARYSLGQWPPTNVGNYTISFDPARVLTELVSLLSG